MLIGRAVTQNPAKHDTFGVRNHAIDLKIQPNQGQLHGRNASIQTNLSPRGDGPQTGIMYNASLHSTTHPSLVLNRSPELQNPTPGQESENSMLRPHALNLAMVKPFNNTAESFRNQSSPLRNSYGSSVYGSASYRTQTNYATLEQEDEEWSAYERGYEQILIEVDEVLEGRDYIRKIQPIMVAENLRQVLKGLETTKKHTKVVVDESDDDDEEGIDFQTMVNKLMKVFGNAQKKVLKKVLDQMITKKGEIENVVRHDKGTMVRDQML